MSPPLGLVNCAPAYAMAQPFKKPVGVNGHVYCKRRSCPGVCPAKVVAHRHGTGKPARCRVCEQEFTLPPGAADLYPANNKKQSPSESNQVKQLKEHNARLKTQLEKNNRITMSADRIPAPCQICRLLPSGNIAASSANNE